MMSNLEIKDRANAYAKTQLGEMKAQGMLGDCNPAFVASISRELARAFVIGFAAGAESQAGVINRRPLRHPGRVK